MTITEFLLARIAEDEKVAKARQWVLSGDSSPSKVAADRVLAECEAKRRILEDHGWTYRDPYESWKGPEYRALWGDTRDLKDCTRCGGVSHHPNLGEVERRDSWPCTTLKALASVYADHPDYDEAWR